MGKDELKGREKWQDKSGEKAKNAEDLFYEAFEEYFLNGGDYSIINRPDKLDKIYLNVQLTQDVLNEIYTPDKPVNKHGIAPDFTIVNKESGKTLYIEVKRQDGWVEGKERKAGRGNAHERFCKYFTPGLLKILREQGQIDTPNLPFWVIFVGDITRDPLRVREITCWFDEYIDHAFFWRDVNEKQKLIDHFENKLKPILE